ncbi:Gfo/Idh/MocA family oxidoreductase [Candidatus Woesearchaeota archaeon]|nr:Gfo/Idh/MocA family oxidoreductase [Candidatus Woesearchaeota archaeon]
MLKAAVIGIGAMGKNHARIYSDLDGVKLVALCDSSAEHASFLAGKYGCKYYADYKEMLSKEKIDLVSIAVPTSSHKAVALDCIAKKINCLIEKPIAPTLKEAEQIIRAARASKVKLTVGHVERFNPAIIELKKRLDNNEVGRVFKIDANRVGPFPSRIRDVGVVIDLATHDIDIMRYLTGSEVARLFAETEQKIHTSNEDLLSGILKFKNNAICNFNINWLTPTKIRKLYVTGEKGMFVVNYLHQDLYFYENEEIHNNLEYADLMRGVSEGKMSKFFINKKEPLKAELEHFADCVANDKKPLVSGEDGLKALEIALKLIESANTNKVIML